MDTVDIRVAKRDMVVAFADLAALCTQLQAAVEAGSEATEGRWPGRSLDDVSARFFDANEAVNRLLTAYAPSA